MWDRLLDLSIKYPLDLISYLSSGLPIILGVINYKKLTKSALFIGLLFVFCFVKDTYALWYVIYKLNTLSIQNVEPVFQTAFVGIIYYYCFDSRLSRQIISGLTVLGIGVALYAYDDTKVSTTAQSTFRLLSIGFSLAYFNKILVDMRIKNVLLHTMFWFSAGLLLYTAGTFFIMLFSEYWYKDIDKVPAEVFDKYWNASQILFILFCCFAAVGLYVTKADRGNYN